MIGIVFGATTLAKISLILTSQGKVTIPLRLLVAMMNGPSLISMEAVKHAKRMFWITLPKKLLKKHRNLNSKL